MRTSVTTLAALIIATTGSHAATIAFNINNVGPTGSMTVASGAVSDLDNNFGDGVVNAAFSGYTGGDFDGLSGAQLFTINLTSLSLDSVGVDDDTASLVFSLTAAGGNGTIDDGGNDWGVEGNGAGRLNADETLTFSFISGSSSITLGAGATETPVLEFKGFNQIDLTQFNPGSPQNEVGSVAFDGGSATNFTTDPYTFSVNPGDMEIGYVSGDPTNEGFKVNTIRPRFEFSTVPEPSSYALITAVFGLVIVAGTRRR